MDSSAIRAKFGRDYVANERTFAMGIDQRFTAEIAERFRNRRVLETCTGGGFTTIALARVAADMITVEIDPGHQAQAKENLAIAGLLDRVTFVLADIMDEKTWDIRFDWFLSVHHYNFIRAGGRPAQSLDRLKIKPPYAPGKTVTK
jgi:tRNA1(Val) A37 N6-methylase TrmN6